jgi:hypothetical protein
VEPQYLLWFFVLDIHIQYEISNVYYSGSWFNLGCSHDIGSATKTLIIFIITKTTNVNLRCPSISLSLYPSLSIELHYMEITS